MIFRDVLEASLEDGSKARSQSCHPGESESSFSVPNLKVEEKEEEKQEPSTSFCPNCVRLKRRIQELEEELSRVRGEQGNVGPSMSEQSQHVQGPPHPEQGPIEDFQGESGPNAKWFFGFVWVFSPTLGAMFLDSDNVFLEVCKLG